jgi:hypothetical protein
MPAYSGPNAQRESTPHRDLQGQGTSVEAMRRFRAAANLMTKDEARRPNRPLLAIYRFAWASIEGGRPEAAAAAVICFEFLQRPENVLAGYLAWPDYRGKNAPTAIKINHHKTDAVVWHPIRSHTCFAPTVSAMTAPRVPSGFSAPIVESRAV